MKLSKPKGPQREPWRFSRRRFLGHMALTAGCGLTIAPQIVLGRNDVPPSERVTVGLIGHGAMGSGHLRRITGDPAFQLVAVCDPDSVRKEKARESANAVYSAQMADGAYKGCAAFTDYRDMLATPGLDAVLIATPDHWHATQSIDAANAGKDVYCEKPISVTMAEGRRLVRAVRENKRIFQTGTQYRSVHSIRTVCNFVREGGLGKVKSIFCLLHPIGSFLGWRFKGESDPFWEGCGDSILPLDFALPSERVPDGLDWNLWVGPAPWREYNHAYHTNPVSGVVPWSFDSAFGVASSTWFLSHSADVLHYAIGMERSGPAEIIHPNQKTYPTLTCRYPNGVLLHFVADWKDIKKLYGTVPEDARLEGNFGGVIVGERGWLTTMSTGGRLEGGPESLFDEMKLVRTPEVNIGGNNHHANWLDCIRRRTPPSADEEIGHRSSALWHLVSICLQLGSSLRWDPVREVFPGNPAANRLLSRAARAPFLT